MSDGPYSKSSTAGSAWPQGRPTDPDEWSEDELDDWISEQMADHSFYLHWQFARFFSYPDGAAW